MESKRPLLQWVIPILALAVGLSIALAPLWDSDFESIPGGFGDTRLVHFSLEHAHRFLTQQRGHLDFWNPPIFYPATNVATYTDTMLAVAPLYTPARLLGAPPDTALQIWMIVVWALNFLAFHVFLRRAFGLSPAAAAAGAYLFAFGSSRLASIAHPQLMSSFFIVLALFAAFKVFALDQVDAVSRWGRRIWIAVFSIALALQLYSAMYPLLFFLMFAVLALIASLFMSGARRSLGRILRTELPALLLAAGLGAVLAAPAIGRYLATLEALGPRQWPGVRELLPHWHSWLLMGPDNWLFGRLQDSFSTEALWRSGSQSNGLGVVTLVCVALGLWKARDRISVRLMVVVSILTVILTTLWPNGWTLWRYVFDTVPGAGAIRAVGRVGQFLLIPAGIGLAFFFDNRKGRWWAVGLLGIAAIIVVEQAHTVASFSKQLSRDRVAAVASLVHPACSAYYVNSVGRRPYPWIHEDAMWATLATGVPTVNGRYGNEPPGWHLRRSHRWPDNPATGDSIDAALANWIDGSGMDAEHLCRLEVDVSPRVIKQIVNGHQ